MSVNVSGSAQARKAWLPRRLWVVLLFSVALVATLVFVYSTDLGGLTAGLVPDSLCRSMSGTLGVCNTASGVTTRLLLLVVALVVLSQFRMTRDLVEQFLAAIEDSRRPAGWLVLSALGGLLLLVPYALFVAGMTPAELGVTGLWIWLVGCVTVAIGLALWLVEPNAYVRLLDWKLGLGVGLFLIVPELSWLVSGQLWAEDTLQSWTFHTTGMVLGLITQDLELYPELAVIRFEDFVVRIGHPCAGLTGIAFTSMALLGYIALMRKDLHVGRALMVIPVIALISWCFNIVRIAVLMMLGAWVSPELAADGFHSYAGWIAFTLITAGMILIVDRVPFFQADGHAAGSKAPGFWSDPTNAMILPFAVFLATSLLAGALFDPLSLGYPLRVGITGVVLLAFWRCFRSEMLIAPAVVPILAGLGIAIAWLGLQSGEPVELAEMAPGLAGTALLFWVVMRLAGTAILVPIIEEAFFRGYLLDRLSFAIPYGRVIGVAASSALFAALHANWILAFGAGVVFALIVLRRGKVMDAVWCHAVANAMIGGYALWTNNWAVI